MALTTTTKRAMFAQETDKLVLALLTLDHDTFAEPIRVVNDKQALVSNGNTFVAYPFDIELPSQHDDSPPKCKLVIDNVSQEIISAVRAAGLSAIEVTLQIVRYDTPDTVEVEWPPFWLRSISADVLTVSGELEIEDLVRESYPADTFNPAYFPGLFAT